MNWWKQAQIQHEAGLIDWIQRNPHLSIPGLVAAGLAIMGTLEHVRSNLKEMPAQNRPAYVRQVSDEVENVFKRNPAVQQEAEALFQEKPELDEIEVVTPEELAPQELDKNQPRGIRNNNPGNIEFKEKVNWQGTSDKKHDGRFIVFETPEYGLRAMARTLRTYQRKHKLDTVRKIVGRWAPPSENDTNSYVESVARNTGVNPDQRLNLENDQELLPLMRAMIKHENGRNPYSNRQILQGIEME